eukprot:834247_1
MNFNHQFNEVKMNNSPNDNNATNSNPQPQVINNAFAIMVSGQPLNTNCLKINNDKYIMDINNPGLITSFGVTILNGNKLPNNVGFAVYYTLNNQNYEFIGVIHGEYPTAIFDSPWMDIKGITAKKMVRIGFELKPKNFLKSLK